jgi:hypothetical protein
MTQAMLSNGLIPVNITTLEKRFNLNSTQSGLFTVFSDIAVVIALIPICHWGNKGEQKVDTVFPASAPNRREIQILVLNLKFR